jgi:hypothetical protein
MKYICHKRQGHYRDQTEFEKEDSMNIQKIYQALEEDTDNSALGII